MANINITKCEIYEDDGQIKVAYVNELEESKEELLIDLIKGLESPYNLSIKKWKPKRESNFPPSYKYSCNGCGNQIKSKSEELHIKCTDCDLDYELE